MDIQEVRKRYEGAYIEDYGDFEIVHVDKKELDWLIEEVQHLQFENETIRRNRTTQERKDFNRIKQLEGEIKTLKSIAQLKVEELRRALELSHSLAEELIKYKEVMKKYDKYSTQSFAKKAGIEL
ncbi:hypothetical protein [Neobacillus sp. 19]|uniref:hypothetical protein n=1 Tax=Neobacillus sp. 19 TaxID=3394458 RepID=UPI003BF66424